MNELYHDESAKCMALTLLMMPGPNPGSISSPMDTEDSALAGFYRQLDSLREDSCVHELLIHGNFDLLAPEDAQIFAYERCLKGKRLSLIANWSSEPVTCRITTDLADGVVLAAVYSDTHPSETMLLRPYEAFAVLK
ncbi:hypothetical protein [Paenibacillus sp. J22TS3]|uniref:hypothetical protein n=1 Tax=Paenibacillus sp. J22TS3 TaxID=2807192 RepID=UPI001B0B4C1C|nr:hypothetical protein [Paenibacillus sp. J22TS3]GIP23734.1 hypothetical protein J22TS3_40090 [Paenibacillus sp. J22TS3]